MAELGNVVEGVTAGPTEEAVGLIVTGPGPARNGSGSDIAEYIPILPPAIGHPFVPVSGVGLDDGGLCVVVRHDHHRRSQFRHHPYDRRFSFDDEIAP